MNSEGEFWFRFCCWYFIKNVSLLWRGEKLWAFGVTSNDYCNNRRFAGKRCLSDVNWVFMDQHFCIPSHIYKWGAKYYISICRQKNFHFLIAVKYLKKPKSNPKINCEILWNFCALFTSATWTSSPNQTNKKIIVEVQVSQSSWIPQFSLCQPDRNVQFSQKEFDSFYTIFSSGTKIKTSKLTF